MPLKTPTGFIEFVGRISFRIRANGIFFVVCCFLSGALVMIVLVSLFDFQQFPSPAPIPSPSPSTPLVSSNLSSSSAFNSNTEDSESSSSAVASVPDFSTIQHPFVKHLIQQRRKYLPHLFSDLENVDPTTIPPAFLLMNLIPQSGYGLGNILLNLFDNLILSLLHPSLVPVPMFPVTVGHTKLVDSFFAVKNEILRDKFWLNDVMKINSTRVRTVKNKCWKRLEGKYLGKNGNEWTVAFSPNPWGYCGKPCQSTFSYEEFRVLEAFSPAVVIPGARQIRPDEFGRIECVQNRMSEMKFVHGTCDRGLMTKLCEFGLCDGFEESLEYHLGMECTGRAPGFRVPEPHGFQLYAFRAAGNLFKAVFKLHPRLQKKFHDDLVSKIVGPLVIVQIRSSWTKYRGEDVHQVAPFQNFVDCFAHVVLEEVEEDHLTLFLTGEMVFGSEQKHAFVVSASRLNKTLTLLSKSDYMTTEQLAGLKGKNLHHVSGRLFDDVVDTAAVFDFSMMNRANYSIITHISTWGVLGVAPSDSFPPYVVMHPDREFASANGGLCFRPRLLVVGNFRDRIFRDKAAWPWRPWDNAHEKTGV